MQHWVEMVWSESSLVIVDRGVISLKTHEKSFRLYDSYNVYLFDNLQTKLYKEWSKTVGENH